MFTEELKKEVVLATYSYFSQSIDIFTNNSEQWKPSSHISCQSLVKANISRNGRIVLVKIEAGPPINRFYAHIYRWNEHTEKLDLMQRIHLPKTFLHNYIQNVSEIYLNSPVMLVKDDDGRLITCFSI